MLKKKPWNNFLLCAILDSLFHWSIYENLLMLFLKKSFAHMEFPVIFHPDCWLGPHLPVQCLFWILNFEKHVLNLTAIVTISINLHNTDNWN